MNTPIYDQLVEETTYPTSTYRLITAAVLAFVTLASLIMIAAAL